MPDNGRWLPLNPPLGNATLPWKGLNDAYFSLTAALSSPSSPFSCSSQYLSVIVVTRAFLQDFVFSPKTKKKKKLLSLVAPLWLTKERRRGETRSDTRETFLWHSFFSANSLMAFHSSLLYIDPPHQKPHKCIPFSFRPSLFFFFFFFGVLAEAPEANGRTNATFFLPKMELRRNK